MEFVAVSKSRAVLTLLYSMPLSGNGNELFLNRLKYLFVH